MDITPVLISLLELNTIERLQFLSRVQQKIQLSSFCEAVGKSQLERLELDKIDYLSSDGRSVLEWLLDMVEGSPAKMLSFLTATGEHSDHFVNVDRGNGVWPVWRRSQNTQKGQALRFKIQFLLWRNQFGRAKLGNANANVGTVVKLLLEVKSADTEALKTNATHTLGHQMGELDTSLLYCLFLS